ncbi:DegV family protein [Cytobacillus depressus]|uniref:DegV family protein n=1 Tax=Cytobacillus depressus TaxID=1602942 RepID=A0A6L3VG03_9BACI|nr:DegV family protein [Cytobacillus depressus]KAB2338205.1 DegV family protein [Cytobacillus depressus]
MTKIAWVTDSTAYLEKELMVHPDVYTIPVTILLDDEEFLEVDLTPVQLYGRLKTLKSQPKTSQPSLGAFKDLYEKLGEKYDVIFSIHLSSKLSGTASSSVQAAQLVDANVITIDSKILTYPLTRIIKKGIELAQSGMGIDEIKTSLEDLRETNETYVLIGSLEQLHRSGRMSGVQFFLGSMLNIIPIIEIRDGALSTTEKVRSERKAKDKLIQPLMKAHAQKPIREAYILYGLHESEALKWKEELVLQFPDIDFEPYPLGAAIGVHAGENTLGISWFNGLD